MKSRKQLIVLIAITAGLTSFLAGYLLIRPGKNSVSTLQQQRGALIDRFNGIGDGSTPTPLPPGLLQATTDTATAPTSAPDSNTVLYYHPVSGHVSKLDLETRKSTLVSTADIPGLINVIWSPNKNRVITISRSSAGPSYKYFDYTTHEHGSLGSNVKAAAFSPDSQRIAIIRSVGSDSVIETSNFDGKNLQIVLRTRLSNIALSWPSSHMLSFVANDVTTGSQSLYTLTESGDLTQLLEGEDILLVLWSPDGSKFLYSDKESGDIILHLFDISSTHSKTLPLGTSATDCAWLTNQSSVICAAESEGETSVSQITIVDGAVKTLFSNLIISPKDVFMSHDQDFVIMTSAADQSIWELKL